LTETEKPRLLIFSELLRPVGVFSCSHLHVFRFH
jgi:hypothetical protein